MFNEIFSVAQFMDLMKIPMDVQLCSHPGARSEVAMDDLVKVLTIQARVAKRAAEHANSIGRRDYRVERMALLTEELAELAEAMRSCDRVEIADALADLMYVVIGTAITYAIPLDAVFQEVHTSNMTKRPRHASDPLAKDVKSAGYSKPNIAGVLENGKFFMRTILHRLAVARGDEVATKFTDDVEGST